MCRSLTERKNTERKNVEIILRKNIERKNVEGKNIEGKNIEKCFKNSDLQETSFIVSDNNNMLAEIIHKLRDQKENKKKRYFFRLATTNDKPSKYSITDISSS